MIQKNELKQYIDKGLSFKDIAIELKVSANTISRYAKKYELKSKIGSQGARTNNLNHNFFKIIDSEEKAYWLGFIAADGCVYKGSDPNSLRLQINLKGSDKTHLDKFQKSIKSSYKIQEKTLKKSDVCLLKVNSTKMCNDLINNNIVERKSIIFEAPELKPELINHFIRGYWDGDGWIKEGKGTNRFNIGFVAGQNMIDYLDENLPTHLSVYKLKCNDNVLSMESGKHSTIQDMYHYLYKDATIYLDRKKDKFENIMSRLVERQGQ